MAVYTKIRGGSFIFLLGFFIKILPKLYNILGRHAKYKKSSKKNYEIIKLFTGINFDTFK